MSGIVVAFPKIEDAKTIKNLLTRYDFSVTGVCTTGGAALNLTDGMHSGTIICSYRLSDMMYGELRESLNDDFDILLLASRRVLAEGLCADVLSIEMPLKPQNLIDTMRMLEQKQYRRRRKKQQQPRQRDVHDEALLCEAKEILMARNHITEEEAHKYIQKTSMNNGTNLIETAQMVIRIMHE